MPVFAAAIFRAMTMCCQYLEYCQLQNTGTTCTEYQQSTKYKKLSSFGGRGGRSNCKLSKPSILHSSKYCSEFGFNIAILLRLFLPYCSCKILYPYTAERRDVLENTLPEAQEISQGRGFCTPRPERLPEGEARGQSRGPRGAKSPPEGNLEGRGGCIFQCIPTRGSVRTFFQN